MIVERVLETNQTYFKNFRKDTNDCRDSVKIANESLEKEAREFILKFKEHKRVHEELYGLDSALEETKLV